MSPRVQTLFDDPLAGSLPVFQDQSASANMLRSLLLRLRLYYDEGVSAALGDQIIAEAGNAGIPRMEYVINEVLYELRLAGPGFNPAFEAVVLNNWVKDLLGRMEEDPVWQFQRLVRRYRGDRKRG